jgi:predicted nuclease with TOPRIM domain
MRYQFNKEKRSLMERLGELQAQREALTHDIEQVQIEGSRLIEVVGFPSLVHQGDIKWGVIGRKTEDASHLRARR